VITPGFSLKVRHVIHTVGPVWRDGANDEDRLLADFYRNSLALAEDHDLASFAFPSISTGSLRVSHRVCLSHRPSRGHRLFYPVGDADHCHLVLFRCG